MPRVIETFPQDKPKTSTPRPLPPLGVTTARSAHATASAVVRRSRHLMAVESGVRNVAEDEPLFIVSSLGARIAPSPDVAASAINALTRHAQAANREQSPRTTWGRKAA